MPEQSTAPKVVYKDIPGFPGYRVGADGSVWSCWFVPGGQQRAVMLDRWRELKPSGLYKLVTLSRDGKLFYRKVHILVLEAFVGPRPKGMLACHFPDRDPANCRLDNLRWDTRRENQNDMIKHGTVRKGGSLPWTKTTAEKVIEIRRRKALGDSYEKLAADFGMSKGAIAHIVKRRSWRHVIQ